MKLEKWKNPLKIDEKYRNYHNCTLKVSSTIFQIPIFDLIFIQVPFIMSVLPENTVNVINDVREKRDIIEEKFIQVFAQQGNFTINLTKISDNSITHVYFSTYLLNDIAHKHFSMAFYQEEYTYMTTPAEAYSSYEKVLLPFDVTTWIFLIITFGAAFVVIFIINRMSKEFQDVVFGVKEQTPSLNVLGAFFGISQKALPSSKTESFCFYFFTSV